MNLFDSTLKSIQNSLFLKENQNTFSKTFDAKNQNTLSKTFDALSQDEKTKLISALVKMSTNPNTPVSNPEILDKIHQTYISSLMPNTSAAVVSKEVTVPGGVASTPYIQAPNASVSTKL